MKQFECKGTVTISVLDLIRSTEEKTERAVLNAAEKKGMPLQHGRPHPDYVYGFDQDPMTGSVTISWLEKSAAELKPGGSSDEKTSTDSSDVGEHQSGRGGAGLV